LPFEVTPNADPYEVGLGRLVNLEMEADFVGKAALRRIEAAGVCRKRVGLRIDGERLAGPITNSGR